MKKILIGLGVLVVLAGAVVTWWTYEFPSATWRYKITVEVETPEGLKTGSAVRQLRQYTDIKIGDTGGGSAGTSGEAVVVDLDQRGKLFMTVGEDHYFLFRIFPFSKGGNTPEGMKYYSHLKNAKASILGLENLSPQIVTFTDIKDPKSVELVYGGRFDPVTQKTIPVDDFEKIFGAGVKLKDITIETTDEPMTRGVVDAVLPWLDKVKKSYLSGKHINGPELYQQLHGGNFKTGANK
jgi:hypothetical protein